MSRHVVVLGGDGIGPVLSPLASPLVGYKTAPLVAKDYSPTFHTKLLTKDLTLAIDEAFHRYSRGAVDYAP